MKKFLFTFFAFLPLLGFSEIASCGGCKNHDCDFLNQPLRQAYISVYGTTGTVAAEDPIPLPNVRISHNFGTLTTNGPIVKPGFEGVYLISYSATPNMQFGIGASYTSIALSINEAVDTTTVILNGPVTDDFTPFATTLSGTIIRRLNAGDLISIVNYTNGPMLFNTSNPYELAGVPVGAQLTLERIGN